MALGRNILRCLLGCGILGQLFAPFPAVGADISYRSVGRFRGIYIEGEIKAGDFEKFREVWIQAGDDAGLWALHSAVNPGTRRSNSRTLQPIDLYLISDGGDAREGFKIGRLVRRFALRTIASTRVAQGAVTLTHIAERAGNDLVCASACAFIWLGGRWREGNGVGFHRPYGRISGDVTGKMLDDLGNDIRMETAQYLSELSVDDRLLPEIMARSRDEVVWLDDLSKRADIPKLSREFEELAIDACGLSNFEGNRLLDAAVDAAMAGDAKSLNEVSGQLETARDCASAELLKLQADAWNADKSELARQDDLFRQPVVLGIGLMFALLALCLALWARVSVVRTFGAKWGAD